ncbi:MAG: hypothetical protein ACRCTR_08965 [Actinomycetota bacterium]
MAIIIVKRLADLQAGDTLLSLDGRAYRTPLWATDPLGPIEEGSPVQGVRVANPNPNSDVEWVFHPSQVDSHTLEVERD